MTTPTTVNPIPPYIEKLGNSLVSFEEKLKAIDAERDLYGHFPVTNRIISLAAAKLFWLQGSFYYVAKPISAFVSTGVSYALLGGAGEEIFANAPFRSLIAIIAIGFTVLGITFVAAASLYGKIVKVYRDSVMAHTPFKAIRKYEEYQFVLKELQKAKTLYLNEKEAIHRTESDYLEDIFDSVHQRIFEIRRELSSDEFFAHKFMWFI